MSSAPLAQLSPSALRRRRRRLALHLLAVGASVSLAGCGLGETAATAAAGGASEAQQAKDAKATEDRVKQQIDDAVRANDQQREDAEKAAQ